MIGSIDILANSTSMAVPNIAASVARGSLSSAPCDAAGACFGARSSRTKNSVRMAVTAIMPPEANRVGRIPIKPASVPPMTGPISEPASEPVDRMPKAQPDLSFGACVAISMVEEDA